MPYLFEDEVQDQFLRVLGSIATRLHNGERLHRTELDEILSGVRHYQEAGRRPQMREMLASIMDRFCLTMAFDLDTVSEESLVEQIRFWYREYTPGMHADSHLTEAMGVEAIDAAAYVPYEVVSPEHDQPDQETAVVSWDLQIDPALTNDDTVANSQQLGPTAGQGSTQYAGFVVSDTTSSDRDIDSDNSGAVTDTKQQAEAEPEAPAAAKKAKPKRKPELDYVFICDVCGGGARETRDFKQHQRHGTHRDGFMLQSYDNVTWTATGDNGATYAGARVWGPGRNDVPKAHTQICNVPFNIWKKGRNDNGFRGPNKKGTGAAAAAGDVDD